MCDSINATSSLNELKRAINKARITIPGKDKINDAMLQHLNDNSFTVILEFMIVEKLSYYRM